MNGYRVTRTAEQLIDYYEELAGAFPLISVEDPLDEEDWDGWELPHSPAGAGYAACGGRPLCDQCEAAAQGDQPERSQCHPHQGEPDRDPLGGF